MKFMIAWKLDPSRQAAAAERFLASGAPMPDGMELVGRWHAPGSAQGFLLVETDDLGALSTHIAHWGDVLEFVVTPVLEDAEAGAAIATGMAR